MFCFSFLLILAHNFRVSGIGSETHYLQCLEGGIAYGLSFRAIKQLWGKPEAALGLICLKEELATYQIHPVLLDACFQVIFAILPEGKTIYLEVLQVCAFIVIQVKMYGVTPLLSLSIENILQPLLS